MELAKRGSADGGGNGGEDADPLYLIRNEVAIMKKVRSDCVWTDRALTTWGCRCNTPTS